jgi:cellulose biosynthesis protein BcsQ
MDMHYYFTSAKGGQGTTVTAALFALNQAKHERRVLLVDQAPNRDLAGVLGVPSPAANEAIPITANLDLADTTITAADYDDVVIDLGVRRDDLPTDGTIVLVTTTCYLALKNAMGLIEAIDRVVVITEDGRALSPTDVKSVLGRADLVLARDSGIARAVDAGLLAHHSTRHLNRID